MCASSAEREAARELAMLEVALGLYGTLAARVGAVMFPPKPRGANERNDRDAGSLPSGSQVPRTDDA